MKKETKENLATFGMLTVFSALAIAGSLGEADFQQGRRNARQFGSRRACERRGASRVRDVRRLQASNRHGWSLGGRLLRIVQRRRDTLRL